MVNATYMHFTIERFMSFILHPWQFFIVVPHRLDQPQTAEGHRALSSAGRSPDEITGEEATSTER
jgi:hypothetical protein